MRVGLAVLMVCVYTDTVHGLHEDDFSIDLESDCPDLDMCLTPTLNAGRPSIKSSGLPCCHMCSCSDDCIYYGNCCYDKHLDDHKLPILDRQRTQCLSQHDLLNAPRNMTKPNNVEDVHYLIIDTCPSDNGGNQINAQPARDFIDYVIVSARDDARIFKNRRVAFCNDVVDVVEWDLAAINCQDMLHAGLESLSAIILSKCYIQFQPPALLADQVPLYVCSKNAISQCSSLYKGDQRVMELCHSNTMFDNALYYNNDQVYANVYCYLCQGLPIGNCTRIHRKLTGTLVPFVALLAVDRMTRGLVQQQYSVCKSFEIYDHFQERCIEQHCQVEAFSIDGQCRTPFKHILGHPLKMLFEVTVVAQPLDLIRRFSQDLSNDLLYRFSEMGFAHSGMNLQQQEDEVCNICSTRLYTTANNSVFFELTISTTAECRLDDALANIRRLLEMTHEFTQTTVHGVVRVEGIKLSDQTVVGMDELHYVYDSICYGEATKVTLDMLNDCPRVYVDLGQLQRRRHITSQVISDISAVAIETNGSTIKICTADYRAIYDQYNSGAVTLHVSGALLVFLFLCVVL